MWTDEQDKAPVCYCEICGGEIYGDGICLRCERRALKDGDEE